jgi:hypothetical protein
VCVYTASSFDFLTLFFSSFPLSGAAVSALFCAARVSVGDRLHSPPVLPTYFADRPSLPFATLCVYIQLYVLLNLKKKSTLISSIRGDADRY